MSAALPRRAARERGCVEWRRRYAAYACPPDAEGVRDPLDKLRQPEHPSTFSLDPAELATHANRLAAGGWAEWELHLRLDLTATAAA